LCTIRGVTRLPASVEIVEVGPRDGLQNEAVEVSTEVKVELIERSIAAGVRRIEATAFVHPRRVPQMADAEALMEAVRGRDEVSFIGLVLNERGLERAIEAGVDEVNYVIVVTDTFSERNQGMTTVDAVRSWPRIASGAAAANLRASVTLAAAFGCPFEGEVGAERVGAVAGQLADAMPDEIAVADTIGVGVPTQVHDVVGAVAAVAPGVPLRIHLHNTRNTGYANAVAALEAGVSALDASTGGIGGCPFAPNATGNIATEDLLYCLDRMGVETGVATESVTATGQWIGERLGAEVPALLGRAGPFPAVRS
jgi:hydroxymethylglutaryl-CoA lyase